MQRPLVSHLKIRQQSDKGVVPFGECRYSAWLAQGEPDAAERSEQLFNATCGLGEPPPQP